MEQMEMDFNNLPELDENSSLAITDSAVHVWFYMTGIEAHSSDAEQINKTEEEADELWDALNSYPKQIVAWSYPAAKAEIKDAIGDIMVTLAAIAMFNDLDLDSLFEEGKELTHEYYVEPKFAPSVAALYEDLQSLSGMVRNYLANDYWVEHYEYRGFIGECIASIEVHLDIIAREFGETLESCFAAAYNVIRTRTGYMNEDGIFVKNE